MCTHAPAGLFPAGGVELEWQQHDALAVSATEAGLSVPVRRSADGKAACPRMETSPVWPNQNQTRLKNKMNKKQSWDQDWDLIVLPGSVLPLLWRDLCLFMYHYFGHWHVRMLFFCLLYGLSQSLYTGSAVPGGITRGRQKTGKAGREQGCLIVSQYANREATFSHICHTSSIC